MTDYNVPVPDSLKAKQSTRKPHKAVVAPEAAPAVPKVVLGSGRQYRVRLRGTNHALPCTVCIEGREISVTLIPNRWMNVPEEIHSMLRTKYERLQEREVPDWRPGDNPSREPRYETPNTPIIEGL